MNPPKSYSTLCRCLVVLPVAAWAAVAWAQAAPPAPASAAASSPARAASAAANDRTEIEADRLRVRLDDSAVAEGSVVVRRGDTVLKTDRLEYSATSDIARAQGHVQLTHKGDQFSGPEAQLQIDRFEGFIVNPSYRFARTQAGGRAERVDVYGENLATVTGGSYTSCPIDDDGSAPWILSTGRIRMDFAANEGIAEGAVLRFYGVPILGLPVMSFPITSARKSGWLPPDLETSSTVGAQVAVPYYWNIAPNHDATLTPVVSTRRGFALGTELRYLQPRLSGEHELYMLPDDRVAKRERWAWNWDHRGELGGSMRYEWHTLRMSDDNYWKDGLGGPKSLTPRLLPTSVSLQGGSATWPDLRSIDPAASGSFAWTAYARVQRWEVLQDETSTIDAPYRREPQMGVRLGGNARGLEWGLETEANRFVHSDSQRQRGTRAHALGTLALPYHGTGFTFTPRVSFNAAAYDVEQPLADGRTRASRFIPSLSLDSRWMLERSAQWFGRDVTQTLEPRLYYVNTVRRDQTLLPNFDSAANDFNATSVFSDNAFSGVDRVSDAHQVTAGLTTRLIDGTSGAETGRFSIAQRYLLRDQFITPDGVPLTERFSDVLVAGSTSMVPRWNLESTLQYNAQLKRFVRSVSSVRYSPQRFRTVNATYRYQRDTSGNAASTAVAGTDASTQTTGNEQVELSWQWPLFGLVPREADAPRASSGGGGSPSCSGAWYSVGRADYNLRDRRTAGGILGLEYDGGCWIGRLVVERQSTSTNQATTRVLLQLELVGLSRLGTNPLRLLKDNIPGYQPLSTDRRGDAAGAGAAPAAQP